MCHSESSSYLSLVVSEIIFKCNQEIKNIKNEVFHNKAHGCRYPNDIKHECVFMSAIGWAKSCDVQNLSWEKIHVLY